MTDTSLPAELIHTTDWIDSSCWRMTVASYTTSDEVLRVEYAIATEMLLESLKRLEQTPGADLALARYLCERMVGTCEKLGIKVAGV